MRKHRVGMVGIGAVGSEMIKVLKERNFPMSELRVIARTEREEEICGEVYHVTPASREAFEGLDFAFFAGTEGSKGASRQWGKIAAEMGVIVIDNGDDFRMDDGVPLIIPELNAEALANHHNFIASPNCSTIIALMAIGPLHKANRIKRFVASTYQAVSGTGRDAVQELDLQAQQYARGAEMERSVYPAQIAFNVIPRIGGQSKDMAGYTSEEVKMQNETRKILEDQLIRAACTCVRVPVFNGHCVALNLEFERPMSPEAAWAILASAPGVTVIDDLENNEFPMPLSATGRDDVLVGRIRSDNSTSNGLALFAAGDNIRKGAALNAVQIAETIAAGHTK